MKFTIVFPTQLTTDLSLAAVFIPCLVWMEGHREILNPHPRDPHCRPGDLQQVLSQPRFQRRLSDACRKVVVVCHPTGYGGETDLAAILEDLDDLGFLAQVIKL